MAAVTICSDFGAPQNKVREGNGTPLQYSCLENPMDMPQWLHFHFSLSCTGEGNGNPLQRSCLENPRDRGAWWAAVYGAAQSRTRLKRLSSSSKIKSIIVSTLSPFICHEVMGPDGMILVFWMLSFKPTFSLFSFTFIKRVFSSSSFSATRVVSTAYLRFFIFLLAILIPACVSSSPAFLMMYSA